MKLKAMSGVMLTVFLLGALTLAFSVQPVVAPLAVDWWPMRGHDLNHTGYSTSTAPKTNKTIWVYTTGEVVCSSPAIVDGKVYVGSYDGKIYCLNASNGSKIWSYTTSNYVFSSPAVADGKVCVGSANGLIYAFATTVWSADSAGNPKSTFNLTDSVYVRGQGFTADANVTIYLVPDGTEATPSNAVANAFATTTSNGVLPATLVWSQPLAMGEYDTWVDVDQNGVLDGGDVWSSQAIGIYTFNVIPEFSLIWILPLLPTMMLVVTVIAKRRHAFFDNWMRKEICGDSN